MRILALDCATEACSAAVYAGGEVAERCQWAPQGHARLLMPMIEAVLGEAGAGMQDLDAVAFGRGPGAFTGVRLATAVAQGIAFAAGLPVVPVSTLAAMALRAGVQAGCTQVAPAIDARMDEVYWGAYRLDGDARVEAAGDERVIPPRQVPRLEGRWIGAGSGWARHGAVLARASGIGRWDGQVYPRAREVAILGAGGFAAGAGVAPEAAAPVYLRDRVATPAGGRG